MLDEDHFYDLRDLPVGAWPAAYLGCRVEYPWHTFSRPPHLPPPINPARRVHYDGAYKRPPKYGDVATAPQTRAVSPPASFTVTRQSLDAMNGGDAALRPPTLPKIHERQTVSAPSRNTAGDLFARSLKPSTLPARPKTTIVTRRSLSDTAANMVILDNSVLPDRELERARRIGDDPARWPFRVSQIEVRRQFQAAFKQSLAEKAKTLPTRPATTSTRFPHLLETYGDSGRR